jgi:hypothetical protein
MIIEDEMGFRLNKLLPKSNGRHGKDDLLYMKSISFMLRIGAADEI